MDIDQNIILGIENLNNNTTESEESSNETLSTTDRILIKTDYSAQQVQEQSQEIINPEMEQHMNKLLSLIEREKKVLNHKDKVFPPSDKKSFNKLKNGIQMIHHNMDNFFTLKINKKKFRKED